MTPLTPLTTPCGPFYAHRATSTLEFFISLHIRLLLLFAVYTFALHLFNICGFYGKLSLQNGKQGERME